MRWWRSGSAGTNSERGAATVEVVMVFPLVLLALLLIFQFGFWYHGRHVALAAAEEGARAARVDTGSAAAGAARAQRFVRELGPSVIVNVQVSASRDQSVARVQVSGWAPSIVPLLHLPIREVSQGPVERFRGENHRFANSEGSSAANPRAVGSRG
jgi:TadE-like protein